MGTQLPTERGLTFAIWGHRLCLRPYNPYLCLFWPNGWIGQDAIWYGVGHGDIVLDEDPVPLSERSTQPHFSAHVYCGQTAGRIQMPLSTEVGLGPGHIMLDGDPVPLRKEIGTAAPTFRPMSIVANRSPISATAELL